VNNHIMGSIVEIPIGTRLVPGDGSGYEGVYAHDRKFYAQPCIILREATKEEYLAQYNDLTWRETCLINLPGVRFYEIQTD